LEQLVEQLESGDLLEDALAALRRSCAGETLQPEAQRSRKKIELLVRDKTASCKRSASRWTMSNLKPTVR
jgi:exonuclease VII small subunit